MRRVIRGPRAWAHGYRAAYAGLPRGVWWLSALLLVSRAGTMVVPFLSLYLTQDLELTKSRAGLLLAGYGAGGAVGAVLGGRWSDRVGPRPVMIASLFLSAIGLLVIGTLRTFPQLFVGLFLFAIIAESFRPANGAALASVCPAALRSRGFALQRLALNVGMTIGPAIGGYLAEVRYELLFWVNSAGCGVSALFLWLVVPRFRAAPAEESVTAEGTVSPWHDRHFLAVMLLLFVQAIVFFQIFVSLPIYYNERRQLSEHLIGWIFAVNTIVIIMTEMVLVTWLDRYPKLRVVAVGSAFFGIGFIMIPMGLGFSYALLTVFVWTIGEMMTAPFVASYAAGRAPQGSAGRYMGVLTLVFALANMVGPFTGLLIYQHFNPDLIWYVGGLLCVVLAVPFWRLSETIRK